MKSLLAGVAAAAIIAGGYLFYPVIDVKAQSYPTFPESNANELQSIPSNVDLWSTGELQSCSAGACDAFSTEDWATGEGKLRFFCEASHLSYDDPIIYPGQPGATHLHQFFGNTGTNSGSTYESLRTTGNGTCAGLRANRSGYWAPAMINGATGKAVKPYAIEFYYRIGGNWQYRTQPTPGQFTSPACPNVALACPTYAVRDIPKGLKLIVGRSPTTGANLDGTEIYWTCVGNGNPFTQTPYVTDRSTPSNGQQTCVTVDTSTEATRAILQVVLEVTVCWNGELDSVDHHSHVKDQVNDGAGNLVCPAGNPYRLPQIILFLFYDHSNNYGDYYFSSDRFNGADFEAGQTFHADFYWAWDPEALAIISEDIWDLDWSDPLRTTTGGRLHFDRRLNSNHITTTWESQATRETDIPAKGRSKIKGRLR
jgi:hypothetical protein